MKKKTKKKTKKVKQQRSDTEASPAIMISMAIESFMKRDGCSYMQAIDMLIKRLILTQKFVGAIVEGRK